MPKALFINSTDRTITEVQCDGLKDMQRYVGGYIERVPIDLPEGDDMWVNEEGMFQVQTGFIKVRGYPTPMAGNALVTGREHEDEDLRHHDVWVTPELLARVVEFMDRPAFDRWVLAHENEPAVTFTTFEEGRPVTEVISTFGSIAMDMPRDETKPTE
jgi:hypothetical protein